MTHRETFADRVFAARNLLEGRTRKRQTLAEFGRLVGAALHVEPFSASTVQRWENGTVPSVEVIGAVAKVCGVDPGWLAYGAECAAPMIPERAAGAEAPEPGRAPAPKLPSTRRTRVDAANEAPPSGRKRA